MAHSYTLIFQKKTHKTCYIYIFVNLLSLKLTHSQRTIPDDLSITAHEFAILSPCLFTISVLVRRGNTLFTNTTLLFQQINFAAYRNVSLHLTINFDRYMILIGYK
jgi:hypothetical protein